LIFELVKYIQQTGVFIQRQNINIKGVIVKAYGSRMNI